ncbi:hypothetical protein [Rhodovibrio sodomensis]|uniref:hypothetical protein n=1 Tax=Rhodovibrio sodomensis TaxID=1088 RepID=UPI001903CD8D|nr:hypothetical protein [Rhodovibrio sodomensis]
MNVWVRTAVACALLTVGWAGSAPAQEVKFECDKRFVFFPGGPQGGAFASIVYNGARLAEKQTGCNVEYVWSNWNPEQMVRQFSQAIGRNPDGIAVMGHPGEQALGPLIEKARARHRGHDAKRGPARIGSEVQERRLRLRRRP